MAITYSNHCPNIPKFDISKPTEPAKSVASARCIRAKKIHLRLIRDDDTNFLEEVVLSPEASFGSKRGFHYHPVINGKVMDPHSYDSAIKVGRGSRRPKLLYHIVESKLEVGGKLTLRTDDDGFGSSREDQFRILDFSVQW